MIALHVGYVVVIKDLRPHPNADRLQVATFFGCDTCVSIEAKVGDVGVYFPVDLQLSEEFCIENHMLRELPDGTKDTGYMDPVKRNVKAIKLRGEKSDGIYLPITCLGYTGAVEFHIGDTIDVVNGHEVCRKYIPRCNAPKTPKGTLPQKKIKEDIAPLFAEHVDTEQYCFNKDKFHNGDLIEVTLKMHGTSARTAHTLLNKSGNDSIMCRFLNIFRKDKKHDGKVTKEWGYVSGTRRCVLNDFSGGFYGNDEFRKQYHDYFVGKLHKGEEVYYEIVGWVNDATPIMGQGKVPKEAQKQYGDIMTFDYGCERGKSDIYVYRMTCTNEDGDVVEYDPEYMRYRCEQMNVKTVPVFTRAIIPDNVVPTEYIDNLIVPYVDGPDPVGKTHVREGVVIRIVNKPSFTAFKEKNFLFKQITGIIKDSAINADVDADILSEM